MNGRIVLSLVRLRLLRILKDRTNLIWLFAVPLMFSGLMGSLMGDWSGSSEPPRFRIYDPDNCQVISQLIESLPETDRFQIVRSDTTIAEAAARHRVENGGETAILVAPAGMTDSLASGGTAQLALYYDSDRLSSQTVRTELERAVLTVNSRAAAISLVDPTSDLPESRRASGFDETGFSAELATPRVTLAVQVLGRQPDQEFPLTQSHQHLGPAYTLMFVFMFLLLSAKDLVQERVSGTLARLRQSRATASDLAFGYLLSGLLIGLVQSTILLVTNSLLWGIDYGDAPLCLVLVVVLFASVSAAASLLMGTLCRTPAQADGLGTAISLMLAALGGLWWPLEVVTEFMQKLGTILPTGQAITIFHNMIGRGYGVAESLPLLGALALYLVVILALSIWRFRRMVIV